MGCVPYGRYERGQWVSFELGNYGAEPEPGAEARTETRRWVFATKVGEPLTL